MYACICIYDIYCFLSISGKPQLRGDEQAHDLEAAVGGGQEQSGGALETQRVESAHGGLLQLGVFLGGFIVVILVFRIILLTVVVIGTTSAILLPCD